jgi:ABC-type lipoprotein export system ATPase subunit
MEKIDSLNISLRELITKEPLVADFLSSFNLKGLNETKSFIGLLDSMPPEYWEESAVSRCELLGMFVDFTKGVENALQNEIIKKVEILPGIDKNGNHEPCGLVLSPGEVTCIVGPTGSGKSRLLADIEWLANADTPTKRTVLINGKSADSSIVNAYGGKLIAQITQNMNFVLDMVVYDFLLLHAQSRYVENPERKVQEVIAMANDLSGEQFSPQTPVTFLSGGQSRALMIADVACIGQAPIVLIDEIENAGVDKKMALELLVSNDKIVLMATHDPMLILLADKRVVIRNGGMAKILNTNDFERSFFYKLEEIDESIQMTRNFFRSGNQLSGNDQLF